MSEFASFDSGEEDLYILSSNFLVLSKEVESYEIIFKF